MDKLMALSTYEPSDLEIRLTLTLGLSLLSPYYRGFARSLNLRGGEHVLDFGSGSGVCSRHIAACLRRGGQLDCVDVSRGWMNVLRKTLKRCGNVGYYLGPITQLDLPEHVYDLVVMHFVLHDIPGAERQRAVLALARRLKPKGRLLLREPQGEGLLPAELEGLAAAAGLQPVTFKAHRLVIGPVYDACYTG